MFDVIHVSYYAIQGFIGKRCNHTNMYENEINNKNYSKRKQNEFLLFKENIFTAVSHYFGEIPSKCMEKA